MRINNLLIVYRNVAETLDDMDKTRSSEIFVQLQNTDLVDLKNRQNLIKQYKNSDHKLISDKIDEITSICKELIRSASLEVSTRELVKIILIFNYKIFIKILLNLFIFYNFYLFIE